MSNTPAWQLSQPINAIIFDCDGTLSAIEGIDELAEQNSVGDVVKSLTEQAMSQTGVNPELYRNRLQLVSPQRDQLVKLGQMYYDKRVQHAQEVVKLLQRLNKHVYVASAGLNPAVTLFAEALGIAAENVFAVDVMFDENGNFNDYDTTSLLASHDGKRVIAEQLKQKHQTIAHIGDGINDFVTIDLVTRFIGFGGIFMRQKVADGCEFYLTDASLAGIIPLLLTEKEVQQLSNEEEMLYYYGINSLHGNAEKNTVRTTEQA